MKKKIETIKKIVRVIEELQVSPELINMDEIGEFVNNNEDVSIFVSKNKMMIKLQSGEHFMFINASKKTKDPYKIQLMVDDQEDTLEKEDILEKLFGNTGILKNGSKKNLQKELQNILSEVIQSKMNSEIQPEETPESTEEDPFAVPERFNYDEIKLFCSQFKNKVTRVKDFGEILVVTFENEVSFEFDLNGKIYIA